MEYEFQITHGISTHSKQRFQKSPIKNSDSGTGLTHNPIHRVPSVGEKTPADQENLIRCPAQSSHF